MYYSTAPCYGAYVSGRYAYIASGSDNLSIVNISNPANPTLVGAFNYLAYTLDVFVYRNYAYLAGHDDALDIIDVSYPADPTFAGYFMTPGQVFGVYVEGEYAYVADLTAGLQIINVSDPTRPTLAGELDTPGNAVAVYVSNNYAYIADERSGLQIIDVSNPSNPVLTGNYPASNNAFYDVYIYGDFAFVTDNQPGLDLINISNPANPTLTESIRVPGSPSRLFVSGGYLYLTNYLSLIIFQLNITGIESEPVAPNTFSLSQNYPNPFNASTSISYDLPTATDVRLDIYDILGRKIINLVNENQNAGQHKAIWNARDASSGIYFCRLKAGEMTSSNRMILLK
jgi:hypothetical protein